LTGGITYKTRIEGERFFFTTPSFRPARRGVLHGEIYNHEFASMLAASMVSGLVYVVISLLYTVRTLHYLIISMVFILSFVISRKYIFRDKILTMILDRTRGIATIHYPQVIGSVYDEIPFKDVVSIKIGTRVFKADTRDAVDFVQKISLQHGSAVPGLGDEEELITLSLQLRDGTEKMIYAGKIEGVVDGEPELPLKEIRDFLGIEAHKSKEDEKEGTQAQRHRV
jgi:hypothetical protein